jgi:hypothetical protein
MTILDRIALLLWRDRGEYEPATGGMSADHNVSLWTRSKPTRLRLIGFLLNGSLWLGIMAGGFAVGAALLPVYLNGIAKPNEQVNPVAGEFLLKCVQEANGVLSCRKIEAGDNDIITGADGNRLNDHRATKEAKK